MIYFDEAAHKYFNSANEPYISCTQLIHLYTPKFDNQYWSLYKVIGNQLGFSDDMKQEFSSFLRAAKFDRTTKTVEYLFSFGKQQGLSKEILMQEQLKKLQEWELKNENSKIKGHNFHSAKENEDRKKHDNWVDYSGKDISYPNLPSNVYPELRLYNHEYKLAGTSDRNIIKGKVVDIEDYKTNEKLVYENKFEKMLYPLHELDNCNINHYLIQLNLYAFMFEELGYKVNSLKLLYEEKVIPLDLNIELVKKLLTHYRDTK